jgi:hypothetical protein
MTKTQQIYLDTIDASNHNFETAAGCLRDGAYLTAAGYTDYDQSDIEIVYSALTDSTDLLDIFTTDGCDGVTVDQDFENETTVLTFDIAGYKPFTITVKNKDIQMAF